ncbi:MAG: glycosyltransferase family 4 protein [bacterium]|nr:glycosyltransferase family 4 protein [bacterium]
MKISILQPRVSYYIGGSEKVALKHAEVLSKIQGNIVTLYTIKPIDGKYSPFFEKLINNSPRVKIIELEVPQKYNFIYEEEPELNQSRWDRETILFSLLVYNKLIEQRADIVLSYYIADAVFRNLNIPNVVYFGGHPKDEIEIYNAFLSFCDATISNSKNVQNMWIKKIQKNKISLNYILPKGAEILESSKKIFNNDDINLVFAGRLIQGKGVEILIEVFEKLIKNHPKAKLWILGDGPEKNTLMKQVSLYGLNGSIIFCGFIENIQDYFQSATICVFPSVHGTPHREGLMTVVVEAMAVGACVVTSEGMGSEELIENKKNGILIKSIDTNSLYKTLEDLISDPEKRRKIGHEAFIYVSENLSWQKVGEELNRILKDVITAF